MKFLEFQCFFEKTSKFRNFHFSLTFPKKKCSNIFRPRKIFFHFCQHIFLILKNFIFVLAKVGNNQILKKVKRTSDIACVKFKENTKKCVHLRFTILMLVYFVLFSKTRIVQNMTPSYLISAHSDISSPNHEVKSEKLSKKGKRS